MNVETYDLLECDATLTPEPDAESLALIEELGLEGQKSEKEDPEAIANRNPYGQMTKDQRFICENLFPQYTEVSKYSDSPIPYRVLKEIKSAKTHFGKLFILHQAPAELRDPVLIGTNGTYTYDIHNVLDKCYLIARWGEALEPWDELLIKARKAYEGVMVNGLKKIQVAIDTQMKQLQTGVYPEKTRFDVKNVLRELPFGGEQ